METLKVSSNFENLANRIIMDATIPTTIGMWQYVWRAQGWMWSDVARFSYADHEHVRDGESEDDRFKRLGRAANANARYFAGKYGFKFPIPIR